MHFPQLSSSPFPALLPPRSTYFITYYILHLFMLFLICLLSQRRNTEQARQEMISVKRSVDSSHHLAHWTWRQASLGDTQAPQVAHAIDTLPTSPRVPFHWVAFCTPQPLCGTLAPSQDAFLTACAIACGGSLTTSAHILGLPGASRTKWQS